jgi:hypothetical protein
VPGRFVPPHRGRLAVPVEDVVRESSGERVEVGQIEPAQVLGHRAILTADATGVKIVVSGA